MTDKLKNFLPSLLLPFTAIMLSLFVIRDTFTNQANILGASLGLVSLLAILAIWSKGFQVILAMSAICLAIRGAFIIYIMMNSYSKEQKVLITSFIIGYHFFETAILAVIYSKDKSLVNKEGVVA